MVDNSLSKQIINTNSAATYGTSLCLLEGCGFELKTGFFPTAVPVAEPLPLPALTGLHVGLLLCCFRDDRALKNSYEVSGGKKTNLIWVFMTHEPSIRPCKLFLTLALHENFDFSC